MEVLIKPIEKSLVLQARGSELVILDEHVAVLKGLKKSGEFIEYFRHTALVNRPARKLFEAWLRKDGSLWKRVYETVGGMEEVEIQKVKSTAPVDKTFVNTEKQKAKAAQADRKPSKPKKKPAKKAAVKTEATPAKKTAAKKTSKAAPKKVAKKTTKKVASKKTTTTKKKTAKKAAKKTTKKTAKKTTKKK